MPIQIDWRSGPDHRRLVMVNVVPSRQINIQWSRKVHGPAGVLRPVEQSLNSVSSLRHPAFCATGPWMPCRTPLGLCVMLPLFRSTWSCLSRSSLIASPATHTPSSPLLLMCSCSAIAYETSSCHLAHPRGIPQLTDEKATQLAEWFQATILITLLVCRHLLSCSGRKTSTAMWALSVRSIVHLYYPLLCMRGRPPQSSTGRERQPAHEHHAMYPSTKNRI